MSDQETFRPVIGYEIAYEVSDWGNVKSLNFKRTGKTKLLTPQNRGNGYLAVTLYRNGKKWTVEVASLVALHFVWNSDPEHKTTVNHMNGIKTDNRAENLEWATHKEQIVHAYETGLMKRGEGKCNAKMSERDVKDILFYHTIGWGYRKISKALQLPLGAVDGVVYNKKWKHIPRTTDIIVSEDGFWVTSPIKRMREPETIF